MGGRGGLIELALAVSFVLAWAAIEWRCRQLDRKKAEEARKTSDDPLKD